MDKDVVNMYDVILTIKKNEIMPLTTIWMDLGIIILSEVNQTKKDKLSYDIAYIWNLKEKKT